MRNAAIQLALCLAIAVASGICLADTHGDSVSPADEAVSADEVLLLGRMSREEVESAMPEWVSSTVTAEPDMGAAMALAELATRAQVTVFFGSWCSDSRRELSRLWKTLDLVGGEVGFPIFYVGVDRSKSEPSEAVGDREILYVPTFIVERDGLELGQIIEESPNGIETDLLTLLNGQASGWISARDDLPFPHVDDDR